MGETHGSTFHALKKKLHNSLFTFSFDHISQSMEPNNVNYGKLCRSAQIGFGMLVQRQHSAIFAKNGRGK